MKKNSHGWILKRESKEQHLSTVPKSCPFISIGWEAFHLSYIYICKIKMTKIKDNGLKWLLPKLLKELLWSFCIIYKENKRKINIWNQWPPWKNSNRPQSMRLWLGYWLLQLSSFKKVPWRSKPLLKVICFYYY